MNRHSGRIVLHGRGDLLEGVDLQVVRELTGGIYFGDKERGEAHAVDTCRYGVHEIERVVRLRSAPTRGAMPLRSSRGPGIAKGAP